MTAYVMMGLSEARQAGVEVDEMVWLRGFSYLENWVSTSEQKNRHVDVFVGYALALSGGMVPPGLLDGWVKERGEYTIYGKALLALTLAYSGRTEEANLLLDNLKDGAWVDKEHGTASFKEKKGLSWWWWWENRTEAVAWALRAFLAIRPDDDIADGFAKWLVENREATHWDSTRLTALSILSLLRYMEVRGDLNAEYEAIVYVNGDERKRWKVGRDNALTFNGSLALSDRELESGDLSVEVEVKGTGRFFAAAFLTYFSQEAKIEGSGSKIEVERTYYKLTPTTRTDKEWGGAEKEVRDFERQKLSDGDPVASGDLIEVQVVIAAPNDYEYLVFEDPKPAGCEPVEVQSGYVFENANTWYREYRDRKVVSFLAFLHQGTQTLSYQLRAEIPGTFRTLPHNAYAMYAPRVRATSDSGELEIKP
jgi:uncharacterized protein YfaS (alpha-2-macroglobulin family)